MSNMNTMKILQYMIIALFVLVIFLLFYGKLFNIWNEKSDANLCRRSVETQAASYSMDNFENLKCSPKYMEINDEKKEDIKKKLADEMAQCFWKFGANEFELFGNDGIYCALCTHVKFKGDARGIEINDFRKYLTTHTVPTKYGKNISYFEYIIGRPTDPDEIKEISIPTMEINTDDNYGIMFIYAKNEHLGKFLSTGIGAGIGTTAGFVTGIVVASSVSLPALTGIAAISLAGLGVGGGIGHAAGDENNADWQSAILLIPYDEKDISKLTCTQMPVKQGNK